MNELTARFIEESPLRPARRTLAAGAAAFLSLSLLACGPDRPPTVAASEGSSGGEITSVAGNQNAPPPDPQRPQVGAAGLPGQAAPGAGSGANPEDPIMACGPVDSYRRIAEYRCPDGSQPFGGDPGNGSRARVGNIGANSTGHVIDLYRVPCADAVQEIYVDMYGCREMQQLLGR